MRNQLAFALLLLLTGCLGFSSIKSSKPVEFAAPIRFEKYVGDMFVLDKVDLHVAPLNSKSKTLMVFPLPGFLESERDPGVATFTIGVAIIAKQDGLTVYPQEIVYISPDQKRYLPTEIVGPFACRSQQPRPPAMRAPLLPVSLTFQACQFMWLEFEAKAPDPSDIFYISTGSLQSSGQRTEMPIIKFSESDRAETIVIP